MANKDAEGQLADFLAKFTPEIRARQRGDRRMRERLPGSAPAKPQTSRLCSTAAAMKLA